MARHRKGLRRWLDLKPKAHAAFSLITRRSPGAARLLDFFPAFAVPSGLTWLHDDEIVAPMAAMRYAAELARVSAHNRDVMTGRPDAPPFPRLRRVVWQAPDIYIPGRILQPVDLAQGRIASTARTGPTNWSVTRPRPLRAAPTRVDGPAVLVPRMKHYGHLLTDYLAPIAFAAHLGLISRERPVTLVHARDDNPVALRFAEGMLRLGLASRALPIGRDEGVLCSSYLCCEAVVGNGEHTYAMPEVTGLLRGIFAAAGEAPAPPGAARVYLTRGDARLRRMEGEAELIALLRERGFSVFEARWTNHAEQLAVFGGCDVLLGVHGAGIVNVVFGKPSARLIEIMAHDGRKTTGLFWAACAGMRYASILGGPEGDRQGFAIDPAEVARQLDALLP